MVYAKVGVLKDEFLSSATSETLHHWGTKESRDLHQIYIRPAFSFGVLLRTAPSGPPHSN